MRICILNAIVQFGIKTAFSNNQRKRNRLKDVRRFVGAIRYVGAVDGIACTVFVFMFFSLTLLNFSRLIFIFSPYFFFIFVSVFIPIDSLVVSFHPPPTIPFISHFFFSFTLRLSLALFRSHRFCLSFLFSPHSQCWASGAGSAFD